MNNSPIKLARNWYPLADVAKLLQVEVEDLIHSAANGEIVLCVLADKWMAKSVSQDLHDEEAKNACLSALKGTRLTTQDVFLAMAINPEVGAAFEPKFIGAIPPKLPESGDPDYQQKLSIWRESHDSQDMIMAGIITYGKHGYSRALYDMPYDGPLPIKKECFKEYLLRPDTAKVTIDLYRFLDMQESAYDAYMEPENGFLVQDVLNDGKVVIKSEEIIRLNSDTEDSKPPGAPKYSTLLKVILAMAKGRYKYDENDLKSDTTAAISRDLDLLNINVSDDTIRSVLKAAVAIPHISKKR